MIDMERRHARVIARGSKGSLVAFYDIGDDIATQVRIYKHGKDAFSDMVAWNECGMVPVWGRKVF